MKTSFKNFLIIFGIASAAGLSACNALRLNSNDGISNLQSPTQQKPKFTRENLQITMERTPCYGACQTYRFTIYGDGKAVWEGFKNVKAERTDSTMLSPGDIEALVAEFEKNNFTSLNDRYEEKGVTDLPSATITITRDGRKKSVYTYFRSPEEFKNVARAIENIATAKGWLERQ